MSIILPTSHTKLSLLTLLQSLNSCWSMAKVYPNAAALASTEPKLSTSCSYKGANETAVVLTVWRKSLLFNCSGFTVFDRKGNLVFRVDSYGSWAKSELVLMDATGKPLLTLRRKKLSLADNWMVYNGEESINPLLTIKRHVTVGLKHNQKTMAHVTSCGTDKKERFGFVVEGCYGQRSCIIYDRERHVMGEVQRKEAAARGAVIGDDVFRLVVSREMRAEVAMAIVIALDQMFESRGSTIKK